MATAPVEGVRINIGGSSSDAPVVSGVSCTTSKGAAVAVPIGDWADLGVSAGSAEAPLLPAARARSDGRAARKSRDDAEERKIKFLASLPPERKRLMWLRQQWWYQCVRAPHPPKMNRAPARWVV